MRQSKQDFALNEKDALQDMLNTEKLLMNYYAAALTEGSCKAFRKEILKNYTAGAETQFAVFEQMLAREFYTVQPAEKKLVDEKKETYAKVLKQLAK